MVHRVVFRESVRVAAAVLVRARAAGVRRRRARRRRRPVRDARHYHNDAYVVLALITSFA